MPFKLSYPPLFNPKMHAPYGTQTKHPCQQQDACLSNFHADAGRYSLHPYPPIYKCHKKAHRQNNACTQRSTDDGAVEVVKQIPTVKHDETGTASETCAASLVCSAVDCCHICTGQRRKLLAVVTSCVAHFPDKVFRCRKRTVCCDRQLAHSPNNV